MAGKIVKWVVIYALLMFFLLSPKLPETVKVLESLHK